MIEFLWIYSSVITAAIIRLLVLCKRLKDRTRKEKKIAEAFVDKVSKFLEKLPNVKNDITL